MKVWDGEGAGTKTIILRNATTGAIYLGGPSVIAATGLELPGNTTLPPVDVRQEGTTFELWAIRQSGTGILHVLAF